MVRRNVGFETLRIVLNNNTRQDTMKSESFCSK